MAVFVRAFLLASVVLLFGGGMPPTAHSASAEESTAFLSSYHVTAKVNSRMAMTSIDMIFENPNEECSDARSVTLQLPRNARLTDLVMNLSDGCVLDSTVKALDDAVQDFEEMASEGKAAALVTAWDMTNYNLRVSVPPNGTTTILLKYQELLWQKLNRVDFQVPLFPGTPVRDLVVDISVEDTHSGILEFGTDDLPTTGGGEIRTVYGETVSFARYSELDVLSESSLPSLLRAHYRPGPLPDSGLMLTDGECFTHLFNPSAFLSDAGSMARRIVFVIDVSGSMSGSKLDEAKASFVSMIDTLDERDTLIVQPFSEEGTESLWGPNPATDAGKAGAKEFVAALSTIGGTNLNDAFLDGIANVYNVPEGVAPVLVVLTDGQGNVGAKITAESVSRANEGRRVKIFSLAFGFDADMDLLLAVAIQNGGRAVRIYEGYGDAVSQMELFYKQELGTIMLSDIDVSYDFGDVTMLDSTVSNFPVLASGSEIVVRGKADSPLSISSRALASTIVAKSALGLQKWFSEFTIIQGDNTISDCRSSFAQARIVELLEYRDAERVLGSDLFRDGPLESSSMSSFEDQAREIALGYALVWPGLTALVTLENTSCQRKNYDVCPTAEGGGDARDDTSDEEAEMLADPGGRAGSNPKSYPSSSGDCTFVLGSSLLVPSILFTAILMSL